MALCASADEGDVSVLGDTLCIKGAREVFLYFTADTTWHYEKGDGEFLKEKLSDRIGRAMQTSWKELLEAHKKDYQALYHRFEVSIENKTLFEGETTDERLEAVRDGRQDPDLEMLMMNYGRYLMISCSRPGGLPATLQGLWNNSMTPPWDSKYTININTEMNYWMVESCGLSECHQPLFELIRSIQKDGRLTAREMYGCRGFVCHHNTDIWGDTAPQGIWHAGTYWVTGAAWLCTHLWTHYQYTRDLTFLKEFFPVMAEAALFFVDFLTEENGTIMEWSEDYPETDPGHKHISHLFALYPGTQITVDRTPKLAEAARKTLERRLAYGGGGTGWSRAWIINFWASLWDGGKAYENIQKFLEISVYPNLFDKHPPFQIDGNFGYCAGICGMLVQSRSDSVVLLPALPHEWENGCVKGMRLIGNAILDMTWKKEELTELVITANSDYSSEMIYQDKHFDVTLKAGMSRRFTFG